jgi:aspartate 4-decarboxylase
MRYCFDSLMENRLLRRGDTIAIGTPTFTPYLEIPSLNDYGLKVVEIVADEDDDWQYPDSEIDQLRDQSIRAFFVVNPGNPTSRAIRPRTLERIAEIVRHDRPDLIIVTDDVYATFVGEFRSLASVVPANTLLVYSFSKHMGCTGWRLAVVALHQDNILDRLIAELPSADRRALHQRYAHITPAPDRLKFIDRMVADSRSVALNHTAGLSLPQQTQMALFALFFLLDAGIAYINATKAMLFARLSDLCQVLGLPDEYDPANADFYATIDLRDVARAQYGEQFARQLEARSDPLAIVRDLAEQQSVVVLPGSGFEAPAWSVRVSLANLPDADYVELGQRVNSLLETLFVEFQTATTVDCRRG